MPRAGLEVGVWAGMRPVYGVVCWDMGGRIVSVGALGGWLSLPGRARWRVRGRCRRRAWRRRRGVRKGVCFGLVFLGRVMMGRVGFLGSGWDYFGRAFLQGSVFRGPRVRGGRRCASREATMAHVRRSKDRGRASIAFTEGYTLCFSHYPPTGGARQRERERGVSHSPQYNKQPG
jgi:hypothetical protein